MVDQVALRQNRRDAFRLRMLLSMRINRFHGRYLYDDQAPVQSERKHAIKMDRDVISPN